MSETIFRSAVVGCGGISAMHLAALRDTGVASVVALCDIRREHAEAMRDAYAPEARIYTNFEEMLRDEPSIEVIHICTPHYLHTPMAVKALSAGKHVFLEKPVGISEKDIRALLSAERCAEGKLAVCFQNRLNDTTVALDRLARAYGRPLGGRAFVTWHREAPYYTESGWRGQYNTEGGGVMINQAIHTLDLLIRYLGKPESLSATTANHHLSGVIEVEDTCEMTIAFEGGATGCFYATTSYCRDSHIFLELDFEGHTVTMLGGNVYDNGEPVEVARAVAQDSPGKTCWGQSHTRLIEKFYHAVASGEPSPVSLESASVSLQVLLAAYRSDGKRIPLP